ncbi:unnamed protein product [Ilex paraguariensis]|uniref:Uncharacterized protein n=1 Tax=Ilex paraguariensis TaxID=185542 RepID=A0ABC8R775_9AQUA
MLCVALSSMILLSTKPVIWNVPLLSNKNMHLAMMLHMFASMLIELCIFMEGFVFAGWADRLWGICCNDEKGQWRSWEENNEEQYNPGRSSRSNRKRKILAFYSAPTLAKSYNFCGQLRFFLELQEATSHLV